MHTTQYLLPTDTRERITNTQNNMDESQNDDAKGKDSDTKENTLCESKDIKNLGTGN